MAIPFMNYQILSSVVDPFPDLKIINSIFDCWKLLVPLSEFHLAHSPRSVNVSITLSNIYHQWRCSCSIETSSILMHVT